MASRSSASSEARSRWTRFLVVLASGTGTNTRAGTRSSRSVPSGSTTTSPSSSRLIGQPRAAGPPAGQGGGVVGVDDDGHEMGAHGASVVLGTSVVEGAVVEGAVGGTVPVVGGTVVGVGGAGGRARGHRREGEQQLGHLGPGQRGGGPERQVAVPGEEPVRGGPPVGGAGDVGPGVVGRVVGTICLAPEEVEGLGPGDGPTAPPAAVDQARQQAPVRDPVQGGVDGGSAIGPRMAGEARGPSGQLPRHRPRRHRGSRAAPTARSRPGRCGSGTRRTAPARRPRRWPRPQGGRRGRPRTDPR